MKRKSKKRIMFSRESVFGGNRWTILSENHLRDAKLKSVSFDGFPPLRWSTYVSTLTKEPNCFYLGNLRNMGGNASTNSSQLRGGFFLCKKINTILYQGGLMDLKNLIMIMGSLVVAFAFNFFLVPYGILSSGISGIAILIGLVTPFDIGLMNLLLNLPLLILGYYKLGKMITINTLICVVSLSVFLYLLPTDPVTDNILLSTIFGGIIGGIGVGIILKSSGTSGGLDIIAIILSRTSNVSVGLLLTGMNGIIVLISGTAFSWNIALYTLLSIYLTGKMIDTIHTDHIKLTMQIVTSKGEVIRKELLESIYRGITIMEGYGGYSQEKKQIIMMVVTRYETTQIKKIVRKHDENAFINIFETVEVDGVFAKN